MTFFLLLLGKYFFTFSIYASLELEKSGMMVLPAFIYLMGLLVRVG